MSNLLFKRWNDFGGWLVFLIAAFVYGMTIEPTASFWDCPEFISCAEKLQVGHPPGAPFYMLVGNLFTQLASDASQVSGMVNFLNALLSAGCILFLFFRILIIPQGERIIIPVTEYDRISFVGKCHQIISTKVTTGIPVASIVVIPSLACHLYGDKQAKQHK